MTLVWTKQTHAQHSLSSTLAYNDAIDKDHAKSTTVETPEPVSASAITTQQEHDTNQGLSSIETPIVVETISAGNDNAEAGSKAQDELGTVVGVS